MSIALTRRTSTKIRTRFDRSLPFLDPVGSASWKNRHRSAPRRLQRTIFPANDIHTVFTIRISIVVSTNTRLKSMRRIVSRMRSVAFRGLRAARQAPMLRRPGYFPFLSALWNQRARVRLSHLLGNASPASDIETSPVFQHSARRILDDSSLKCHKNGKKRILLLQYYIVRIMSDSSQKCDKNKKKSTCFYSIIMFTAWNIYIFLDL